MPTPIIMPSPRQRFFDSIGLPLVRGYVFTFAAGTSTKLAAFQDAAGLIPHENPIRLDSRGEATVYWLGNYKVDVRDALGIQVPGYPVDNFQTPVTPDALADLNTTITGALGSLQLADYAALFSYNGPSTMAYVTGYMGTTRPTGIAGAFIYDPTDETTIANGGTVIGSTKGGRWKRVYQGEMEVDWFGAFGALDSKASITAAIAAAQNTPGGAILGFRAGATYKMLSGITWNSTLVGFRGRGATLDCTAFTNQILLQPTQSGLDNNERTGAAWMHSVEGLRFRGPGFAQAATCILVDAPADNLVNAGLLVKNCVFQAWSGEVVQRAGAFFCTFDTCNFQGIIGAGTDTAYGIRIEAGTNSGEKTTFRGCLFGGRNLVFSQANGNADTFFYDCSFDYFGKTAMVITGGSVSIVGGHTEGNSDAANWYTVSGEDTMLTVSPTHTLTMSGPKSLFSPFYSDSTCTNGGIRVSGMNIVSGTNAIAVPLISGTGRTKVRDCNYGLGTSRIIVSAFQNKLSYPSFEDANYTVDWTLSGTIPPARTNEVTAQSGTYSLKFAPAVSDSNVPTAFASVVCQAGDFCVVEFYYLTVNLAGTGATFFVTNYYVDKAGNQIGMPQQILATTANVGTWTKVTAGIPKAAPGGTHGYRAFFSVFGTASGTPKAYIDSVSITIG